MRGLMVLFLNLLIQILALLPGGGGGGGGGGHSFGYSHVQPKECGKGHGNTWRTWSAFPK